MYKVVYDTEYFCGEIERETFDDAKECALSILEGWLSDVPYMSQEEVEQMYETSAVTIYSEENGELIPEWEMEEEDLKLIGWDG